MGLFNWFAKQKPTGKKPVFETPDAKPAFPTPLTIDHTPKPDQVTQLGENSPMVVFSRNGVMMVMDRDAYDYTYGPVVGTNPAQRDVDELFPKVTRVVVLEGAMFQGKAMTSAVLANVTSPAALQTLQKALQIVEDPRTFGHCHCLGGPTLECYAGSLLMATISLQHGKAIRWKRWHPDAQLQDGSQLTNWLLEQGIDQSVLDVVYQRGNNHLMSESPPDAEYWKEFRQAGERTSQLHREGRIEEALPIISSLIDRYPQRSEPYSLRADVLDTLGRVQELLADADRAIELGMRQPVVYFQRARCRGLQGKWNDAVADCSNALSFKSDDFEVLNFRAVGRVQVGEHQGALEDWARAIELAPDWFGPRLQLARYHYQQGKLDEALKEMNQAIACYLKGAPVREEMPLPQPILADLYLQRGDMRYDLFQEKEALADFAEAERLDPNIAGKLGELWLRRGDAQQAMEAFTRIIRLQPDDARGYGARAAAYQRLKEYDKALADLSTAIHLPPDIHAYSQRGLVYLQLDRMEEALQDFNKQLEAHPDDIQALLNRAIRYARRGDYRLSLLDRVKAFELTPGLPMSANMLAWALATTPDETLRDGPRAVTLAQQACEATQWKESDMIDTLAAACAEAGNFNDAIHYQQLAISLLPTEQQKSRLARLQLYQAGQPYRDDPLSGV